MRTYRQRLTNYYIDVRRPQNLKKIFLLDLTLMSTEDECMVRKLPKFLVTAESNLSGTFGPNISNSLIYPFIGCLPSVLLSKCQGRFYQILWPSQNILTLIADQTTPI